MEGESSGIRAGRSDAGRGNGVCRRALRSVRLTILVIVTLVIAVAAWAHMTFYCENGFGAAVDVPVPLASLKTAENPILPGGLLRDDLTDFIQDKDAAIRLGKALYWDMQAGSDGKVACATCHAHAGVDGRTKNQLHPGANMTFDIHGPNTEITSGDFPFTDLVAGTDADDVLGSQGVPMMLFKGLGRTAVESVTSIADPLFNVNGRNVRQVTGIQSPSTINSVFNHRNFWDGRAQTDFNGVNPFGIRDQYAQLYVLSLGGSPVALDVHIQDASLASQAVGPPLNPVEMSAMGRTFADIAKKLLSLKPLGLQQVSPTDSVLGSLADTKTGKGLTVTYTTLIQQSFHPKWWDSKKSVKVGKQSYTMMQANFSLFWGLSIMLYEATLVSDDTPIDQYLDSGRTNPAVLDSVVARLNAEGAGITRENILNGLRLFETPLADGGAACVECHGGPELTLAAVAEVTGAHDEQTGDHTHGRPDFRMERMFMNFPAVPEDAVSVTYEGGGHEPGGSYTVTVGLASGETVPVPVAVYDAGFYDVGVRPLADGLGLGGLDPFGIPLSFTRYYQWAGFAPIINVIGEGLACNGSEQNLFTLTGPLQVGEPDAIDGSYKTPSLRNVELTGPYFRNGGKSTLWQVMEFYVDGSDFPGNPNLAPLIVPLGLSQQELKDLVAFMVALTDERVRWRQAPFDHPEIGIPMGQNPDGSDIVQWLPAVGAGGASAPLGRFLDLSPFQD